jgi:hypothetical protein
MSLDTLTETGSSTEKPFTTKPTFRRRRFVAVASTVAILAAAGLYGLTRPPEPVLISDGAGQLSLIDVDSGEPAYTISNAVRAPAGDAIVRAAEQGEGTEIEVLNPDSGEVISTAWIERKLEIRAVSPFGGAVALMKPRPDSVDLYVPEPLLLERLPCASDGTHSDTDK